VEICFADTKGLLQWCSYRSEKHET